MHPANGQQHMAWVQAAGGAGGAGGRADPLLIQQKQQALALDALKAETHIAGQPVHPVAVQGTVGNLAQALDEPVTHGRHPGHILIDVVAGFLQRGGHAADARNILRTCALAPLLGAALNQIHQWKAPTDIQRAHALGAVELVAGEAQHIDVLLLHMDVQVSRRLHRVGVEGNSGFPADRADFRNRQDRANLVVGVHGGHQAGIRTDGILHLLGFHIMTLAHIQIGNLKALFFQLFQGMEHGVVLKSRGDNVFLPMLLPITGGGDNGLIVSLAAAGGENDFSGITAQAARHRLPGSIQRLLGPLPHGVQAGGVAIYVVKIRKHGTDRRLTHFGCRGVIGINLHLIRSSSEFYLVIF